MFSELDEVALCGSLRQLAGRLYVALVPLARSLAPSMLALRHILHLLPFWWVGEVGFCLVGFVKSAPRYIVHLLPFWWGEGLDFRVKGGLVN